MKKPKSSTQKTKRYIALARVSSREQEREGFSLDIQVDALKAYAERQNGTIIKLWRIAETASKADERKTFKELIAYAKKHAIELDGILFYKVDRAARNLFDYVELERLESEFDVNFPRNRGRGGMGDMLSCQESRACQRSLLVHRRSPSVPRRLRRQRRPRSLCG